MTPKEKCDELIRKFIPLCNGTTEIGYGEYGFVEEERNDNAKKCALICVEEIISASEYNNVETWNKDWWENVKSELEKL